MGASLQQEKWASLTPMSSTIHSRRPPGTVLLVGAGPGLGAAVARRFGQDGDRVVLLARDTDRLAHLAALLRRDGVDAFGVRANATNFSGLSDAIEQVVSTMGPVHTLCYCPLPRIDLIKPLQETTSENLMDALALSVGGVAAATRAALPHMQSQGYGRLLFTTGSGALHPNPARAASAIQTIAEKAYLDLLTADLSNTPITVGHLTVVGAISETGPHTPADVATELWTLARDNSTSRVLDNPRTLNTNTKDHS